MKKELQNKNVSKLFILVTRTGFEPDKKTFI